MPISTSISMNLRSGRVYHTGVYSLQKPHLPILPSSIVDSIGNYLPSEDRYTLARTCQQISKDIFPKGATPKPLYDFLKKISSNLGIPKPSGSKEQDLSLFKKVKALSEAPWEKENISDAINRYLVLCGALFTNAQLAHTGYIIPRLGEISLSPSSSLLEQALAIQECLTSKEAEEDLSKVKLLNFSLQSATNKLYRLPEVIKKLPNLQTLVLTNQTALDTRHTIQILTSLPKLQSLSITDGGNFDAVEVIYKVKGCRISFEGGSRPVEA